MTATMGELGEAANIAKKLNRVRDGIPGNTDTPEELRAKLADEIADVAIYLDLMAQASGFDLETIRDAKFAGRAPRLGTGNEARGSRASALQVLGTQRAYA
jgi:NTP pyrophosphatase (non-canonical NTP hydrolase)